MSSIAPRALFVHTTVADEEDARRLAEAVIETRLAACVQIGAPVTSLFRWESQAGNASRAAVQTEREIPVVIKTTAAAYPALERTIEAVHPYELPEIVALPVLLGLPAFLAWIDEAVSSDE
jgi:periplasmic divalent cation tolerance protein